MLFNIFTLSLSLFLSKFSVPDMAAPLQYLETLRNAHPELGEWYASLADLYQRKLWHQLTAKLEQFVALTVFQVSAFSSSFNFLGFLNLNNFFISCAGICLFFYN